MQPLIQLLVSVKKVLSFNHMRIEIKDRMRCLLIKKKKDRMRCSFMDIAVVFQLTAAWSHVRQETNGEGIKLLKINWVSTSDTCIHHSQRHLQTQSLLCCMTIGFSQTASMAYVPRPFVDPEDAIHYGYWTRSGGSSSP